MKCLQPKKFQNLDEAALTLIELDEFKSGQMHDRFCTKIRLSPSKWELLSIKIDNDGFLIRIAQAGLHQMFVQDVLKQTVL